MPAALAVAVSVAIAALAWGTRLLTRSGALAAALVGTLCLAALGWPGGGVLLAFFLPSSLVSRATRGPEGAIDPKGEVRGSRQVLANGLVPSLGCWLAVTNHRPELAWFLVTGGLATAAADTWATAVGSLSRVPPRLITTGRSVPRGANGGVTALGTAGAALGAALVGGTVLLLRGSPSWLIVAVIIGMGGMGVDAVLGATGQARFFCRGCGVASEWPRHRCGQRTEFQGGIRWMDNDVVNAIATSAGTLAGALWWACS